ncbi:MAG: trypsin-like serine protease [Firmicutes bacterium]|nr:trypsin-like serine protease [Bacillota bacterium]
MNDMYQQPYFDNDNNQKRGHGFGYTALAIVALASALLGGIIASYIAPTYLFGKLLPWPNNNNTQQPGYQLPIAGGDDPAELAAAGVVAEVAAKVGPAVIGITNRYVVQSFFRAYENQAVGSGIIIDANGYIVTNNHVVADSRELTVTLAPGVDTPATLVGRDPVTDLAVIKIDPNSLPAEYRNLTVAQFGDSDKVRVGELAIAIGNPLGLQFQRSTSAGIISGLDRDLQMEGMQLKLLQTDAAINSGNSGGALCDKNGYVIGINQAKIKLEGVEGMGFAIPSNVAKPIIEQLIQNGKVVRPFLGVTIGAVITPQLNSIYKLGTDYGLYIESVSPLSPASMAGIKARDILIKLAGEEVRTFNEMQQVLYSKEVGEEIDVVVVRNGKEMTMKVKLVAAP